MYVATGLQVIVGQCVWSYSKSGVFRQSRGLVPIMKLGYNSSTGGFIIEFVEIKTGHNDYR